MSNYTDSVPESFDADYYFTTDPARLKFSDLDTLWRKHWLPLGEFPNQISVARLIRHFTRGKLFLDVGREFILLANGKVYQGPVAVYKVFDLVLEWFKAFVTQNSGQEERHLSLKFSDLVLRELSNHKSRENMTALLRNTLMSETIDERGTVFGKSDLPCLVRSRDKSEVWLGKFSLLSGKIAKTKSVGLFPVLSGLEFDEGYELQAKKEFKDSKFRAYLCNLVGNNDENISFIGRLMGFLCEEGNDLQHWVWLQGPAGNGKTVFVDILATILGQLAVKGDNAAYDGSAQDQRFARAAMENRRLAYFSELSKWFKLHDGKLKGDTEGKIRIEGKYKDSREITNTCKPIFISNHSVSISDETDATRGRLILLETCGVNWRESDGRVARYHETLWQEEREVILQFLVDSYKAMAKDGLRVPVQYQGNTEENRVKTTYLSDRHSEYISERIVRKEDSELTSRELKADYRYWSLCNDYGEVSDKELDGLCKAVTRIYGKAQKSNGTMKRKGLALVEMVKAEEEINSVVDKINGGI